MNIPNLENLSIGEPMWLLLLFLTPIIFWLKKGKKRNTIKFSSTQNFEPSLKSLKINYVGSRFVFLPWHKFRNYIYSKTKIDQSIRVYYQAGLI